MEYPIENGRRYHAFREGSEHLRIEINVRCANVVTAYVFPNDEVQDFAFE